MSQRVAVHADSWLGPGDPTDGRSRALASDLFEQHSEMVLSVCRVLLPDAGEAEDAMQQTFLYAYRSILSGSEPQRPAPWLATIARNECLNRLRARIREPHAEAVSGRAPGTPDALNVAIAREDLQALGRTIRELPSQQREALLLHEFCGLPYREVAATIGVSESAIGSLLFRARTRLRAALRRSYASLPIPALWNAVDHLLARGPAAGTAGPAVAKLGTAAVAVGLTASAAVVVDQDLGSRHGSPPPPAHRSAAPATAPTPTQSLARVAVAAYTPRVALRPTAAEPSARSSSPAKPPHTTHPARAVPANHPAEVPVVPASQPHFGNSETTSLTHGRSGRASGEARSGHGAAASTTAAAGHGNGRALGRTRPPKAHGAKPTAKAKADERALSPVSGSEPPGQSASAPPGQLEQHGNAPEKTAGDHGNSHAHQEH